MFVGDRQQVLGFIDVLGSQRCGYGTWPDGPCDCKYGYHGAGSGSEQTGCPELRSLRLLIAAMTDEEWALLTQRANGIPAGLFVASPDDIRARLHRAHAAVRMAESNLGQVRGLLTLEPERAA